MKEKKITIRIRKDQQELIAKVAKYLGMDLSETIRNSLRFGLNSLLKFETSGKMTLKKMADSEEQATVDQYNLNEKEKKLIDDFRKAQEEYLQEQIEIANVKWLTDEGEEE